jgi:7,8-dihydroneopterin aldolase/epimerase/oxygenase
MTLTIEVRGLELYGYHGVNEDERRDGQRFLFDLHLDVPERAARTDRLEDAVDYLRVAEAVKEVSDETSFHLLEALASAVAEALFARFPVSRVLVRVRKPDVKLAGPVDYAAITLQRESP